MSVSELKTINCPNCGGHNKVVIYQSINPADDHTLRRDLLNESLFIYKCSHCNYCARLTYPVLYNDVKNRFMVYFIPNTEKQHLTDRILEKDNLNIPYITKRLVTSFNDFKEKIIILETGFDDMAIELTKLALRVQIKRSENKEVREGYFSSYEDGNIGFTFFSREDNTPFISSTQMQVYLKSKNIVKTLARKEKNAKGFIRIDRMWAQEKLYQYRKYGFEQQKHN